MSGGPKGPLSPPQELEVGNRRPPYLLVKYISGLEPKCLDSCSSSCSKIFSPNIFHPLKIFTVPVFLLGTENIMGGCGRDSGSGLW